jgi:hypothetical protein
MWHLGVETTLINFCIYPTMLGMEISQFSRPPTFLVLLLLISPLLPFANPVTSGDDGMTEARLKALQ